MTEEEAKSILAGPKSYATWRDLPDGGIEISALPRKADLWPLALFCLIVGPMGFFFGLWLTLRKPPLEGPMSDSGPKLLVLGALAAAMGPAVVLIRLVTGPPKPVELQVKPGELRADRSIVGDRVRSMHLAKDVFCLFTDGSALYIETRKGHSPLVGFGSTEVNRAIAFLISRHLWASPHVIVTRRKKPFMSNMPERVIFSSLSNDAIPD